LIEFSGSDFSGPFLLEFTMTVEEALYATLIADDDLAAIVGTKIFPQYVPQSAAMPAITYEQAGGDFDHTVTEIVALTAANFVLTAWSADYDDCRTLADAIRKALNAKDGLVVRVFLSDESDACVQPADIRGLRRYECQQEYKIWFHLV